MPRDFGEGQELSPTIAEQKAAASPVDQLTGAMSGLDNKGLVASLNDIVQKANESSNAMGALDGIIRSLTADGQPLSDQFEKLVACFGQYESIVSRSASSTGSMAGGMSSLAKPVQAVADGLSKLTVEVHSLNSIASGIDLSSGFDAAIPKINAVIDRIKQLQDMTMKGVTINVNEKSSGGMKVTGDVKKEKERRSYAKGGTVHYSSRNSAIAVSGGRFVGRKDGDKEMAFVNAGEAILTERALKRGARQAGMSVGRYVNRLNSGDISEIKRGRSFAEGTSPMEPGSEKKRRAAERIQNEYNFNPIDEGKIGGYIEQGLNELGKIIKDQNKTDTQQELASWLKKAITSSRNDPMKAGALAGLFGNSGLNTKDIDTLVTRLSKGDAGDIKIFSNIKDDYEKIEKIFQGYEDKILSVGDALKKVDENGLNNFKYDMKRTFGEGFGKLITDAEGGVGKLIRTFAMLAVSVKAVGETARWFQEQASLEIGFDKAMASARAWGDVSSESFRRTAEGLNLTRKEMQEFGGIMAEMGKGAMNSGDLVSTMASNMKNAFGEVDMSALKEAVALVKDLPAEQTASLFGGGSFENGANMLSNLMKGGSAAFEKMADAQMKGAFGENDRMANISEADKQIIEANREMIKLLDDMDAKMYDLSAWTGGGKWSQYANGATAVFTKIGKIIGSISMIGIGFKFLKNGGAIPVRDVSQPLKGGMSNLTNSKAGRHVMAGLKRIQHSFQTGGFKGGMSNLGNAVKKAATTKMPGAAGKIAGAAGAAIGAGIVLGGAKIYANHRQKESNKKEAELMRKNNSAINMATFGVADMSKYKDFNERKQIAVTKEANKQMMKFGMYAGAAAVALGALGVATGGLSVAIGAAIVGIAAVAGNQYGKSKGEEKFRRKQLYYTGPGNFSLSDQDQYTNIITDEDRAEINRRKQEALYRKKQGYERMRGGGDVSDVKLEEYEEKNIENNYIKEEVLPKYEERMRKSFEDSYNQAVLAQLTGNGRILTKTVNGVNQGAWSKKFYKKDKNGNFVRDEDGNFVSETRYKAVTGVDEKGRKKYGFLTLEQINKKMQYDMRDMAKTVKKIENIERGVYTEYMKQTAEMHQNQMASLSMMGGKNSAFQNNVAGGVKNVSSAWEAQVQQLQRQKSEIIRSDKSIEEKSVLLNRITKAMLSVNKEYIDGMKKFIGQVANLPELMERRVMESISRMFMDFQNGSFMSTGTGAMNGAMSAIEREFKNFSDVSSQSSLEMSKIREFMENNKTLEKESEAAWQQLKINNNNEDYTQKDYDRDSAFVDAIEKEVAEKMTPEDNGDAENQLKQLKELMKVDKEFRREKYDKGNATEHFQRFVDQFDDALDLIARKRAQVLEAKKTAPEGSELEKELDRQLQQLNHFETQMNNYRKQATGMVADPDTWKDDMGHSKTKEFNAHLDQVINDLGRMMTNKENIQMRADVVAAHERQAAANGTNLTYNGARENTVLFNDMQAASSLNVAQQQMISDSMSKVMNEYKNTSETLSKRMGDVFHNGSIEFAKAISSALLAREKWRMMGSGKRGNEVVAESMSAQIDEASRLMEAAGNAGKLEEKIIAKMAEQNKKFNDEMEKQSPENKYTDDQQKYIKDLQKRVDLMLKIMKNPEDTEAQKQLLETEKGIAAFENSKDDKDKAFMSKPEIQGIISSLGTMSEQAKTMATNVTEAMDKAMKVWEEIPKMIERALQDMQHQVDEARADAAMANVEYLNKYVDFDDAVTQGGIALKKAADSMNSGMEMIEKGHQNAMDAAVAAYKVEEEKAVKDRDNAIKNAGGDKEKINKANEDFNNAIRGAAANFELDRNKADAERDRKRMAEMDKMKQRIDTVYGVKEERAGRVGKALDIQKDTLNSIGAPFEFVLQVEQNIVKLAREEAKIQEDKLAEMEAKGFKSKEIEEQKLKVAEAQAKVLKAAFGAQRDSLDKMLGKMMGTFQEVGGIFGPDGARMLAKKYGQGYSTNESGMAVQASGGPDGYAQRSYHNSAIANGFGHPLTVGDYGNGLGGQNGFNSALETANSVLRTFTQGNAKGRVGGKSTWSMSSFTDILDVFGRRFMGEDGTMENRSSDDSQLAFFKPGEKIIPEKGAAESAQQAGVPDSGLADAYRKGDLLGYMLRKSPVIGKAISVAGRAFGRSLWRIPGHLGGKISPADAARATGSNSTIAGAPQIPQPKEGDDPVLVLVKQVDAIIKMIKSGLKVKPVKTGDRNFDTIDAELNDLKGDFAEKRARALNEAGLGKFAQLSDRQLTEVLAHKKGELDKAKKTGDEKQSNLLSTEISTIEAALSISGDLKHIEGYKANGGGEYGPANSADEEVYSSEKKGADAEKVVDSFMKDQEQLGRNIEAIKELISNIDIESIGSTIGQSIATVLQSMIQNINNSQNGGKQNAGKDDADAGGKKEPGSTVPKQPNITGRALGGSIGTNAGIVSGKRAIHMSFDKVRQFFGNTFKGENGMQHRSSVDTELALFKKGEKIIPEKGARQSAKGLGVSDYGLADAYRKGKLAEFLGNKVKSYIGHKKKVAGKWIRGFEEGGEAQAAYRGLFDSSILPNYDYSKNKDTADQRRAEAEKKANDRVTDERIRERKMAGIAWIKKKYPERYAKLNDRVTKLKDKEGNNYASYEDWYEKTQLTEKKLNKIREESVKMDMRQYDRDELVRRGIDPDTGKPYVKMDKNGNPIGKTYDSEFIYNRVQDENVFKQYGFDSYYDYKQYQKSVKNKTFKQPKNRDELAKAKGYKSYGDMIKRYDKYAKEQGYKNYNDMLVQKKRERENEAKKAAGEAFLNNIRKTRENQIRPTNLTRSQKVEYCLSKLHESRMEKNIDENLNEIGNILNYKRNTGTLSYKMPAQNVFRPPRNSNTPLTPAQLRMLGMHKNSQGKIRTTEEGAEYLIRNYGFELSDFVIVDDSYVTVPMPAHENGSAGIMGYENGGSAGDYWKNTFGGFATANAANLVSDFKKAKDFVSGGSKKPSQNTKARKTSKAASPQGGKKLNLKSGSIGTVATTSSANSKPAESTPRAFWSLSDRMQNKAMNGDIPGNMSGSAGIMGYENGGSAGDYWKNTFGGFATANASNLVSDFKKAKDFVSGGSKKPSQKTVKKQNSAKPKASKLSVKPVTVKMGTTSSEARPKTESTPRAFWSLSDRMQNKAMNGDIFGNSNGNIGIYGYENGGSAGGWWKDTLTSFAKRNASNFAGDVSRIGEIGRDVFGKVAGIFGHGQKSNSPAAGTPQTKPAGQNPKTYASLSMLGSGDSSLTLESFNPMETQGHFDGLVRGFDKGGEAGDNGDDMFVAGTMDSSHEERERERDEGVVEEEENMKKAEEEARIKRKEAAEKHASKSAEHFRDTYRNYQLGKIAWLKKNDPERYAKLNEQAKRLKDADGNNYKSYKDWYKRTQLTDEKINEQAEKIYNDEMKQHERDELVRQGIDPDTGKPYVRRYENGLVTQGQLYTSEYELNRAQDNFVFLKYGFNSASAYKQYQKSLKDKTFKKPQTRDEMAQLKGYKSYGEMAKRYDDYAKEQGFKSWKDMAAQRKRERENEAKKAAGEAFLNNIRKMRENQIQPTNLARSQKVKSYLSKLDVSRMEKNIDENLNEIGNILNYKRNTGTLSYKMPVQNVFRPPRNPNTPLTPAQLRMLGMNKNRRGKIRTTEEGAKYLILNYGFDLDDFAIVDDQYMSVPVPAHENGSAGIMGYENGGSVGDYWKNTLGNFAKTNAGNFVSDMKTAGTTVMRGASGVIGTLASVKKPNAQAGGKPASKAGKKAPAQTKAALDRRSLMDNSIMLDSFNAGASTKGNENGSPGFGISRNTVDGKNSLNARRSDIIGWLGGSTNSEDNQIALFKRDEKVIPADKAKESADKLEVSDYGLADAYRKGVLGEFLGSNGIFADSSEKVESYENGKAGDDRNKQNGRSSSDMNGLNPGQTIYMPANITQAADYAGVNANPETLSPTMAGGMAGVMMSMLNGGNGGGAAAGQQAGDMNMGTVDMTGSMDSGSYTVRFLVKMDPESLKGALSGETEKNIVSALKNGRTAHHF